MLRLFLFTLLTFVLSCQAGDIYWKAGVSGDWSTPLNWEGGLLPAAGDVVYITGAGTYTVTYGLTTLLSFGGVVIGGASGTQTVTLTNTLVVAAASALEIKTNAVVQVSANINFAGTLKLAGGQLKTTSTNILSVSGAVVCTASSTIDGAKLTLTDTATWTIDASTTLTLSGNALLTFAGTHTLNMNGDMSISSGSKMKTNTDSGACKQSGSGKILGAGSFENFGSYTITAAASATAQLTCVVANQGTFTVAGEGTVTLASTFSQPTNSSSFIVNGKLDCSTTTGFSIVNGTLGGSGSISSYLSLGGILAPGNSPGTVTLLGDFSADRGSILIFEMAGTGMAQHDSLVVIGKATILGWIQFKAIDPYAHTLGDQISFLKYGSATVSPLGSYHTGNGFALKKPKLTVGSVSTSMQTVDLFSGASSQVIAIATMIVCLVLFL